jgi:hypothetical protein
MKPTTDQASQASVPNLNDASYTQCHDDRQQLEPKLKKVVETMSRLTSNGTLDKGSSLANAFEKFVSASEGRLAKLKASNEESTNPCDNPIEGANPIRTLAVIESAIAEDGMKRTLVHVTDVQRSVASTLEPGTSGVVSVEAKDGFEEEDEHKEKARLMIFDSLIIPNDS